MTRTILLDIIAHADLCVASARGVAESDVVNKTLVFATEIERAQREFPLLIQRDVEGAWQLVALLGLDRDENLFLDNNGWMSRYVPAVHRRGPFLIGMQSREGIEQPMIHIDLDDPRVGTEGEPLFLPHGGNSPYLDHVADTLRTIHEGQGMTRSMFTAFETAGLIAPIALNIELDDGRHYSIANSFTIDADRLAALEGSELHALNAQDFLRPAFAIRASLDNVEYLIERKRAVFAG